MFSYKPNQLISSVTIFGLGGTGARLASLICQQLVSENYSKAIKVILVDGDTVELKNCKRQLFVESEVGKNKAEVIATRYRRAFGANIIALPHFMPNAKDTTDFFRNVDGTAAPAVSALTDYLLAISSKDHPEYQVRKAEGQVVSHSLYKEMGRGLNVFILAVDSVPARQGILAMLQYLALMPGAGRKGDYHHTPYAIPGINTLAFKMIVIDGGNEDTFGQVNYFHPAQYSLSPFDLDLIPDKVPYKFQLATVPMPTGRYLKMVEGGATRRCGDMEQTLAINNLVASNMHLIFQNLFYNLDMTFHKIRFGLNGSYVTSWMDVKWMKGVLSTDNDYAFGTLHAADVRKVNGVVDIAPLSRRDALKYGFLPTALNTSESLSKNTAIGGMAITMRKNSNANDYCTAWSDWVSYATYGAYLPLQVLQGIYLEEFKGLYLYTNTTLLDVSWSEIMLPVLLHLTTKGWVHKDKVLEFLNVLKESQVTGFCDQYLWQATTLVNTSGMGSSAPNGEFCGKQRRNKRFTLGYSCVHKVDTSNDYLRNPEEVTELFKYQDAQDREVTLLVEAKDGLPYLGVALSLLTDNRSPGVWHVSAGMACLGAMALLYNYAPGIFKVSSRCLNYLISSNHLRVGTILAPSEPTDSSHHTSLIFRDGCVDDCGDSSRYISVTRNGEVITKFDQRFIDLTRQYLPSDTDEVSLAKFLSRYSPRYMQEVETVMPDLTSLPYYQRVVDERVPQLNEDDFDHDDNYPNEYDDDEGPQNDQEESDAIDL